MGKAFHVYEIFSFRLPSLIRSNHRFNKVQIAMSVRKRTLLSTCDISSMLIVLNDKDMAKMLIMAFRGVKPISKNL